MAGIDEAKSVQVLCPLEIMKRLIIILALLVILPTVAWQMIEPGPEAIAITSKPYDGEDFVYHEGIDPIPFTGFAARQKHHPYMGSEGGGLHGNHYNSGFHMTPGPSGEKNLWVKTRRVSPLPGGVCPTIILDKQGLLVAMCASFAGFEIDLFAPHTLELLASHPLVTRPSTFEALMKFNLDYIFLDTSGGSYFYLDNEDRVVLVDASQQMQRIAHRQTETGKWEFLVTDKWDLNNLAPHDCLDINNWFPSGECDPVTSVMPDFQGRIWWVSRKGRVGVVNPNSGNKTVHHFKGEEIQNSLSADAHGMYVITDYALYNMVADEKDQPQILWKQSYPRVDKYRYGQINIGSGSTPTLLDGERGRQYVVITDAGEERVGLVVYRREKGMEGERIICRVPLFSEEASAIEISPIGWGRSVVVKSDAGYRSAFHGTSEAKIPGGIWRVDIREDNSGCDVIWKVPYRVPAVVNKLSSNGLLYYYTFDEQANGENAWYFLALDFNTGKPVFKKYVGSGQAYDINWGSPAIAKDGTVYLGIFKGIIALGDN